jgi:CBS domain-containing protein
MAAEPLRARDLMSREVHVVGVGDTVEDVLDILMGKHIHGAPVVDADGTLVGIVTQQDILFGSMTREGDDDPPGAGSVPATGKGLSIADIMTSPPVCASEDTEVRKLCEMMVRLRIQRVPIVADGKVTGILTALDICGAVSRGEI